MHLDPHPAKAPLRERNGLQHGNLLHQRVGLIRHTTKIHTVFRMSAGARYQKIIQENNKNYSPATAIRFDPHPAGTPLLERKGLQHGGLLH